jgi:exosortase
MGTLEAAEPLTMTGKMRVFILLTMLAGLGVFVYGTALSGLFFSVLHRQDASHGLCVPFISAYLVWLRFEQIKRVKPDFAPVPGIVIMGVGLLLLLFPGEETEVFLPALSFLLVAAGLVVGLFGKDAFKELRFPLFFLVAMIPLPKPLYAQLTEGMRMATTWLSVWVLQLFHFPIYREGYNVYLPNMNLFIANSCSGIRYLIPYFVFGLAYAFVCKKTLKSRGLVVLATIPISIIGGGLRQSLIFLSAHYIGPFMAEHRPHVIISWFVFVTVLVGAMALDRWAGKRLAAKRMEQSA